MAKQKYLFPILALIVANMLWGIATPLIKIGLETIPVPLFISIRFFLAALLLLPFAIRVWRPLKRSQLLLLMLAAILDITLSVAALNLGLTKTTASNAGIIWLLMPIILFVLSVSFLKEKLSLKTFIGIMLALAGSLVIIGKQWNGGGMTSLTGNLLVVLAVFLNAIAIIIIKPLTKRFHHFQIAFLYYLIGILPMMVYASTRFSGWQISHTTARSWAALLAVILTAAAANPLFYYALKFKTVQNTGVYLYLDPLTTVIGAWFLLSERPTTLFYAGAILVVGGVYLVEVRTRKHSYA
ncbi:MAG: DMT family transporter [Candidatus Saccharimonadales bacterium]